MKFVILSCILLFCISTTFSSSSSSSPPLTARIESWPSSLLLELFQTTSLFYPHKFFPILNRIHPNLDNNKNLTPQQIYSLFLEQLEDSGSDDGDETGTETNEETLALWKLSLATRESAPIVLAAINWSSSRINTSRPLCDGNDWVEILYDDTGDQHLVACTPQEIEQLLIRQAKERHPSYNPLPFDHSYPPFDFNFDSDSDNSVDSSPIPTFILYGSPTSPTFNSLHEALFHGARGTGNGDRKWQYVLRWRGSSQEGHSATIEEVETKEGYSNIINGEQSKSSRLMLNGWGAGLDLKKTDYLVIDDRNREDEKHQVEDGESKKDEEEERLKIKPLKSSEISDISLRSTFHILSNSNSSGSDSPLLTLLRLSQSFPTLSHSLPPLPAFLSSSDQTQEPSSASSDEEDPSSDQHDHSISSYLHQINLELLSNIDSLLTPGSSTIWLNGIPLTASGSGGGGEMEPFKLLKILRRELGFLNSLRKVGIGRSNRTLKPNSNNQSLKFLSNPIISSYSTNNPSLLPLWHPKHPNNLLKELQLVQEEEKGESQPRAFGAERLGELFDSSDRIETNNEGGVIEWWNDLEKDKRYRPLSEGGGRIGGGMMGMMGGGGGGGWSRDIKDFLRPSPIPTLPPLISLNLLNMIYSLDFSQLPAIKILSEGVASFVGRGILAVRFGVVPAVGREEREGWEDDAALAMAKIFYYLFDNAGRAETMKFFTLLSQLEWPPDQDQTLTTSQARSLYDTYFSDRSYIPINGAPTSTKTKTPEAEDTETAGILELEPEPKARRFLTFDELVYGAINKNNNKGDNVADDEAMVSQVELKLKKAREWSKRLGVLLPSRRNRSKRGGGKLGAMFGNGKYYDVDEDWRQSLQQSLQLQQQFLSQQIYLNLLTDDNADVSNYIYDLPTTFKRRNEFIFPSPSLQQQADDDEGKGETGGRSLKAVDLVRAFEGVGSEFEEGRFLDPPSENLQANSINSTIWIVGDFDDDTPSRGKQLLIEGLKYLQQGGTSRLSFVHNPKSHQSQSHHRILSRLHHLISSNLLKSLNPLEILSILTTPNLSSIQLSSSSLFVDQSSQDVPHSEVLVDNQRVVDVLREIEKGKESEGEGGEYTERQRELPRRFGFAKGETGIVINGRVIGPLPKGEEFLVQDFETLVDYENRMRIDPAVEALLDVGVELNEMTSHKRSNLIASACSVTTLAYLPEAGEGMFVKPMTGRQRHFELLEGEHSSFHMGTPENDALFEIAVVLDPVSEVAQRWSSILHTLSKVNGVSIRIWLNPSRHLTEMPLKRFYRFTWDHELQFDKDGFELSPSIVFNDLPEDALLTFAPDFHPSWLAFPHKSVYDLDNIRLADLTTSARATGIETTFRLEHLVVEGHAREMPTSAPPRGLQLELLGTENGAATIDTVTTNSTSSSINNNKFDTTVMANLGYFQLKSTPGVWQLSIRPEGRSSEVYYMESAGGNGWRSKSVEEVGRDIFVTTFEGMTIYPRFRRRPGMEKAKLVISDEEAEERAEMGVADKAKALLGSVSSLWGSKSKTTAVSKRKQGADINVFTVASGLLYERMAFIMILSVLKNTQSSVKFWFIQNFLSPSFKEFIPRMAEEYGFDYELVTYKWPSWLRTQKEKQRTIWGYKILFLDVLFPLELERVIFVDSDQIVRADLKELADLDLKGAPYAYAPMGDSRPEIEGFRFWKTGYWRETLRGLPYHISALYVVDLDRFRQMAAGDRLRGHYQALSADPNSLANLDQDLPNVMQFQLPIYTLDKDWLWCETWCSDESLKTAKTIDLCNNPMTHEPKLARAKRLLPEWTIYDQEVAALAKRLQEKDATSQSGSGAASAFDSISRQAGELRQAAEQEAERKEFEGEPGHDSEGDAETEMPQSGHPKDEL